MSIEVNVKDIEAGESKTHILTPESSILDLLENIDFNPETVVVKRNGKIVPEDEIMEDGDEIEIIPVVSGG